MTQTSATFCFRSDTDTGFDPVKLRLLRQDEGLTQHRLADLVGVSRDQVCHWETGVHKPKRANLAALAEALGVSIAALCYE